MGTRSINAILSIAPWKIKVVAKDLSQDIQFRYVFPDVACQESLPPWHGPAHKVPPLNYPCTVFAVEKVKLISFRHDLERL